MKNINIQINSYLLKRLVGLLPAFVSILIIIVFGYLTYSVLNQTNDSELSSQGQKRVQEIDSLIYNKATLERLLQTPEVQPLSGQGGKNPFQTF